MIVLDGWGISDEREGNAIAQARTPNMDRFLSNYPHTILRADGGAVGLLEGQMGNSNVGHLNLGAGRVVYQAATRISRSIDQGDFFENAALNRAMEQAKAEGRALHLLGLVSDGGVHSQMKHLYALLRLAAGRGVERVFVHAFLDGRDTPPRSAVGYLRALEAEMQRLGAGKTATVCGRYFAMDRDKRWERTERAYRLIVHGEGERAPSALDAVARAYERGESDEFVQPTAVTDPAGAPPATVRPGDAVVFFNYRADRARQLLWALAQDDFAGFPRERLPLHLVTMTAYDESLGVPVAFPREHLHNTLGEVISRQGWRQLRIAETEKYAHVTYFFNGGEETAFPGEERVLIPSPKVATYDQQPEMSAPEVTRRLLSELATGRYRFIVLNYANPDMVGHTGNLAAAIKAIEAVDECLGQVVDALLAAGGAAMILSDHGNAEKMFDRERNQPHTAHTLNPVPCVLVAEGVEGWRLKPGTLADIAPTLLILMGIAPPPEMDGHNLLVAPAADEARLVAPAERIDG